MTVRRNILAGWASHGITVLIGFFLMPYILGTVGEAQYGAWVFINAVAGYSGMIYSGFGATICRYVADLSARQEWRRLNVVVSSIQLVYFITASAVFLFTAIFAWWAPAFDKWDELPLSQVQASILIVGVTIGLGMIASVYGGVLIGTQRLDVKRSIEVSVGILRLILTVVCLQQKLGLVTLALIFCAVTAAEHAVSAWFAYRQVPTLSVAPWHASREALAECFGFSAFNAVALVAEYLIYFTDTVVIGLVLGPRAVVPYQIGLRIAQMVQVPIAQVGEVVLPKAGELYARRAAHELGQLVARGMGLAFLFSAAFFIGAGYFGDVLIRTWIGPEFVSSQAVLMVLLATQMVALPMVIARKALLGIGQVRVQAFIDLAEAFLNLVLSLILIRFWGVIGVAWGTLIPLVLVELCVLLPYAVSVLELPLRALGREISRQTPALLALLGFCIAASPYVPRQGWLPLMAVTLAGGAVLGAVRWTTHLLSLRRLASLGSRSAAEVISG